MVFKKIFAGIFIWGVIAGHAAAQKDDAPVLGEFVGLYEDGFETSRFISCDHSDEDWWLEGDNDAVWKALRAGDAKEFRWKALRVKATITPDNHKRKSTDEMALGSALSVGQARAIISSGYGH